jgi:glycolate oxidase
VSTAELATGIVDELRAVVGDSSVLTDRPARFNRTRVAAPFPVHRWRDFVPQAVVLPRTAQQVAEVVRLANRHRVPIVPRAGGTGLADGAVPLHGGIVVDVKLMNGVHEVDLDNRTVTVGPGINMLKLNEQLRPHGVMYPDDPSSYPCSLVGGRIGTNGFSLIAARYGHTRDLVVSMELVLPTGEIIRVGDGGGRNVRKSSTGYQLKHLFMGHQGTLGIVTEATLELVPRPEMEFSAYFSYPDFAAAYASAGEFARSGLATLAAVVLFDERKVEYLRRDDEAYIPQPPDVRAVNATVLYGTRDEVEAAARRLMRIARESGGRYLGDEVSQGDWASRHERYATPLHGRLANGDVVPMCWHCEDASIPYPEIPSVARRWHEIVDRYAARYGVFDNWGIFFYTNGAYKPWADMLGEIDVGIWEQRLDDETWSAWVACKREIAMVSLEHGGSITACHGATRAGDVELVPREMGGGYDVMKAIKRTLDPNNIMNPGKYLLDQAYAEPAGERA